MTNRPGRDWTPLGYWADPVPGDGSEVQAFADIFRKTETSLVSARDALRPVTNGDMIGVRADNIRTEASAVESKLGLVQTRYAAAASALQTYGNQLVDFQRRSLQILDSAAGPARDLQSAQGDARWRYAQLLVMLPGPERDGKIMDYNRVRARSDALKSEVDQAKAELHRIIEERDNAASTAAATIRSAVDHSGLNDTPWDMAKEFAAEALDFLDRNASTIGDVLGWISSVFWQFRHSLVPPHPLWLSSRESSPRLVQDSPSTGRFARQVAPGIGGSLQSRQPLRLSPSSRWGRWRARRCRGLQESQPRRSLSEAEVSRNSCPLLGREKSSR